MSIDSRSPMRVLRRSKKEPDRPDYSEPDFSSWAARLDQYVPTHDTVAAAPAVVVEVVAPPVVAPPVVAPPIVSAPVVAETAPVAVAVDERPSLSAVLEELLRFDGAMCVAVVDSESGMILSKAGSGVEMNLAAAGASTILRARLASNKALGSTELIDDVLISLTSQVQIIHPLPSNPSIFTYLIADQAKSSLAMARYKATEADSYIQL